MVKLVSCTDYIHTIIGIYCTVGIVPIDGIVSIYGTRVLYSKYTAAKNREPRTEIFFTFFKFSSAQPAQSNTAHNRCCVRLKTRAKQLIAPPVSTNKIEIKMAASMWRKKIFFRDFDFTAKSSPNI